MAKKDTSTGNMKYTIHHDTPLSALTRKFTYIMTHLCPHSLVSSPTS